MTIVLESEAVELNTGAQHVTCPPGEIRVDILRVGMPEIDIKVSNRILQLVSEAS